MRRLKTALLLAALVFLSGCVTNPSTGRRQFLVFSDAEVAAMGEQAKPQIIAEFGGEVSSPELRAYVDDVGRDLLKGVEPEYGHLNWEFFALNSDVINAFALPGGKIFITRGLMEQFDNEAQLAGVLGHEIGHVTAKHVDERLTQAAMAQIGLELLGTMTEAELVNIGAGLLAQGVMLKFSRAHENESDRQGVKYMSAARYDPQGMVQVLEVLEEASRGGRTFEMLSTHPYPETRIELVRGLIQQDYAATQDNPSYKKYRRRYQNEAVPHLR